MLVSLRATCDWWCDGRALKLSHGDTVVFHAGRDSDTDPRSGVEHGVDAIYRSPQWTEHISVQWRVVRPRRVRRMMLA